MINEEQCIRLILEKFPDFKEMWQEHLDWWGEDTPGFSNDMAVFSEYTIKVLQKEHKIPELKVIFQFIEALMHEGTGTVKDAAATCFLENLINATSWGTVSPSSFVHLLGKESIKYCKAWDEFTGVKTKGLWDDDKE